MCLKPRTIRNPTKYLSPTASQQLLIDVSCNNCAECKEQKRQEWHFRSYHEIQNCISHGGYVYYDTLTYDEDNVPRLSHFLDIDDVNTTLFGTEKDNYITDFYVFNSSHWRNFLKNLRRQLDYHYKGTTFKYFITSEYGTDERYTHRPHYHPLFFVYNACITPYEFSALVSKCWNYGRTDGLPYQSRKYVAEHVFGYNLGQKDVNDFIKCASYVSKYITKDSTFQDTINKRIIAIEKYYAAKDKLDVFRPLKRDIDMFHRQSQGYGISYLNTLTQYDYNAIIEKGVCFLNDKKKVKLTIPLPLYYRRKLFYNLKRDDDGTYYWQPNANGYDYLMRSVNRNIENVEHRYLTTLLNADNGTNEYVELLLNGRTLHDLAEYVICYRSRFKCPHIDVTTAIGNTFYIREKQFTDLYFRDIENDTINISLGLPDLFDNQKRTDISYTNFLNKNIYNENTRPDFKDFDKILAIIEQVRLPSKTIKQQKFDFIEDLTKKFKHLYNYGK